MQGSAVLELGYILIYVALLISGISMLSTKALILGIYPKYDIMKGNIRGVKVSKIEEKFL